MRKILIVMLLIAGVVGVGIMFFVGNVDRFVKNIIESAGTRVVGTSVTVGSVELSLGDRRVLVRDLEIANPPGFSPDPAFRIGEISAQLDSEDYQVIRKIFAGEVSVQVESRGLDTNFKQLQENIRDYSSRSRDETGTDSAEDDIRLVIDLVEMEKAQARLVSDVLADPLVFGLDKFMIRDLAGTPEEIGYQLMQQVTAAVVSAAALKVLEAQTRGKGSDLIDAVQELIEQAQERPEDDD